MAGGTICFNPIAFSRDAATSYQPVQSPAKKRPAIHSFPLALRWRHEIAGNPQLTQSHIAVRDGISRARVTQVMKLLHLPAEIHADLLSPPDPLEIHDLSERSLRVLVSYQDEEIQTCHWGQLVQELKSSAGN